MGTSTTKLRVISRSKTSSTYLSTAASQTTSSATHGPFSFLASRREPQSWSCSRRRPRRHFFRIVAPLPCVVGRPAGRLCNEGERSLVDRFSTNILFFRLLFRTLWSQGSSGFGCDGAASPLLHFLPSFPAAVGCLSGQRCRGRLLFDHGAF